MPRNGSGLYVPPPANYPAVSATTITAANRNAIDADIATALTNSIAVNGESVVTADIPFGNNKLTGVKDGTLAKDAANVSQIQNSNAILLASVAGTDTITASLSPALTAYANGQIFTLIPANTNTGAVTININGLGAKSITKNGSTALVAGDLVAGVTYSLQYDGTRFQKIAGSDYAKSGANSDITSLSGLTTALAASGANSDITSLSGLTTPLSQAQGGTGANTIPVFSAYQSSAQTLATATYTKITVDTEEYDTNNNFATSRFTCTVPGYYLFTAGIAVGATRTEILPVLYKNGSAYRNFGEDTTASGSASGSMLIKLDATDYVEFYAYFALGQVTTAGSRHTYFQGHLVKAT